MPGTRRIYYQALQVGDELPAWHFTGFERLRAVRYAGASGDFNPLYFDEGFARAAGFRSVLVPGPLALGVLARTVQEWLKAPCLRRLHAKYLKIIWPGDALTCRGRISGRRREGGSYLVDLELWIENADGETMVRGDGTASLFYSAQDEAQRLAGGPPLIVDDPPDAAGEPAPGEHQAKPDAGARKQGAAAKAAGKSRR